MKQFWIFLGGILAGIFAKGAYDDHKRLEAQTYRIPEEIERKMNATLEEMRKPEWKPQIFTRPEPMKDPKVMYSNDLRDLFTDPQKELSELLGTRLTKKEVAEIAQKVRDHKIEVFKF